MLFDREPQDRRYFHGALGGKCPNCDAWAMEWNAPRRKFLCHECRYTDVA